MTRNTGTSAMGSMPLTSRVTNGTSIDDARPFGVSGTENVKGSRGLLIVPEGHPSGEAWELATNIYVDISESTEEFVAELRFLELNEYGVGDSSAEAIHDLLTSLGEYRELLESMADELASDATKELGALRKLVRLAL